MKRESLLDRFVRYAKMDTQSLNNSKEIPSTDGQKVFLKMLMVELKEIGLEDIEMDSYGMVMATLPSNIPQSHPAYGKVPTIGLLAHVDTYFDTPGKDVKPQIHTNYDGGLVKFQKNKELILDPKDNPELLKCKGLTVITADGTTLLGADDKAGVAEIMDALVSFIDNPKRLHGNIRVGFTPDEETSAFIGNFDVKKFGANYAYTMDGGVVGEIENETFCADAAQIIIKGTDTHPGYAKNKMLNAFRIGSDFVMSLPQHKTPETTEKREGFLHLLMMSGVVSEFKIDYLVRDFTEEGLKNLEDILCATAKYLEQKYLGAKIDVKIDKTYRNMIYLLEKTPEVIDCIVEAVRLTGVELNKTYIRGGTDGSRLSYMGLPTPNIFCGFVNIHGLKEFVVLEWMEKAVEVIMNLMDVWVEKSK